MAHLNRESLSRRGVKSRLAVTQRWKIRTNVDRGGDVLVANQIARPESDRNSPYITKRWSPLHQTTGRIDAHVGRPADQRKSWLWIADRRQVKRDRMQRSSAQRSGNKQRGKTIGEGAYAGGITRLITAAVEGAHDEG